MGLGRTTRFAKVPKGARRVSVMRGGLGGIKALAPPEDLLADFLREKAKLMKKGAAAAEAHAEAARQVGYRDRYLRHVRGSRESMEAMRGLIRESKEGDVYVMCMCPYQTREKACHTYLILDLARKMDKSVKILPEPRP